MLAYLSGWSVFRHASHTSVICTAQRRAVPLVSSPTARMWSARVETDAAEGAMDGALVSKRGCPFGVVIANMRANEQ